MNFRAFDHPNAELCPQPVASIRDLGVTLEGEMTVVAAAQQAAGRYYYHCYRLNPMSLTLFLR